MSIGDKHASAVTIYGKKHDNVPLPQTHAFIKYCEDDGDMLQYLAPEAMTALCTFIP